METCAYCGLPGGLMQSIGTEGLMVHRPSKCLELLKAEIERLRAIVDKLPKTADGVPVVPDVDTVWSHIPELGGVRATSDTNGRIAHFVGESHTISFLDVLLRHCYSTREAAEAAKEE